MDQLESTPSKKKLPPKQRLFLKEWLIDKDAKEAYIRAYHYTGKNADVLGPQLLGKLRKMGYIESEIIKQEERTGITADYVLSSLKDVAERCRQAIPVMEKDPDGNLVESGEWKFDSAGANRALELLGKNLRLFIDKIEHSGGVTCNTLYQIVIQAEKDRGLDGKKL